VDRGTVRVDHHIFMLADHGIIPGPPCYSTNGLICVQGAVAFVRTGISMGVVAVTVEPRGTPPPEVDAADWDEVVEISLEAPAGQLKVAARGADGPGLPQLSVSGPGWYRIRAHCRGRDANFDGVDFEPVEQYSFVVWPSEPEAEITYKNTDQYGASGRAAALRRMSQPQPPLPSPTPTPQPGPVTRSPSHLRAHIRRRPK
jgi:hypothetical protein